MKIVFFNNLKIGMEKNFQKTMDNYNHINENNVESDIKAVVAAIVFNSTDYSQLTSLPSHLPLQVYDTFHPHR